MIKAGKKTKQWNKDRAEIKKDFIRMGIFSCEVRLPECWNAIHGFAHGDKRNNLTPEQLRNWVIGACNACHHKIEYDCKRWTGMTMGEFVTKVIASRSINSQEYTTYGKKS